MRPDLCILLFLCASVFAKPMQDDNQTYTIEIVRNVTQIRYHDKKVEINYNASEIIEITFIRSTLGEVEVPFMKLYWIKDKRRIEKDAIKHNFRRKVVLTLTAEDNDCTLQCEIWLHGNKIQTLEVHFLNSDPSEKYKRNTGSLFVIILIALGSFIAISILIMILIAIYKCFKNKTSSGYHATTYPDYHETIPMNKINSKPKNVDDNTTNSERGVVNNSLESKEMAESK